MTNCSKCGNEVSIVPPGISKKSGKPYGSFYKCKACGNSQNVGEQPPKQPRGNEQLDRIEKKLDAIAHFLGMNGNVVSN